MHIIMHMFWYILRKKILKPKKHSVNNVIPWNKNMKYTSYMTQKELRAGLGVNQLQHINSHGSPFIRPRSLYLRLRFFLGQSVGCVNSEGSSEIVHLHMSLSPIFFIATHIFYAEIEYLIPNYPWEAYFKLFSFKRICIIVSHS